MKVYKLNPYAAGLVAVALLVMGGLVYAGKMPASSLGAFLTGALVPLVTKGSSDE